MRSLRANLDVFLGRVDEGNDDNEALARLETLGVDQSSILSRSSRSSRSGSRRKWIDFPPVT